MALPLLDPNDVSSGATALLTQEQIAAQKKIAAALASQAARSRPMTHPLQAVAQGFEGLTAGLEGMAARNAESARAAVDRTLNADMAPGGSNPITSNAAVTPSAGASTPMKVEGDAPKTLYHGLVARGLSPTLSAGIVGNLHGESGFKTNIWGDNNTSFGLAQWRGDRLTALRNLAAQQGKDPSDLNVQLDHIVAELKGPERRAFELANAAKTPEDAAWQFARHFERPADWALNKSGPGRAGYARGVFDRFGRRADAGGGAPIQVASVAPAVMSDAQPASAQVAGLPPAGAPLAQPQPAPAPMTGALPSMAAANMGLLPAPPSHWQAGPGSAESSAPTPGAMPPITPAATPFPGRQSVVVNGRDTSLPGATAGPASGQVAARGGAPASNPIPLPPRRPANMTPQEQVAQAVLAQQAGQATPMGMPEQMADQASVLQVARSAPAVQAVVQALARQGAPAGQAAAPVAVAPPAASQAAPAPAPITTGSVAPVAQAASPSVATVSNALSGREQAAWRAISSPYASEGTKKVAATIIQQADEQRRYERGRVDTLTDRQAQWGREDAQRGQDRQNVVGDRQQLWQREDVRRVDDHQRADRTLPLDMKSKQLAIDDAERKAKGYRSLITPEERAAAGVPADFKGSAQLSPDGQLIYPGKASTEVNVNQGGGSDKQIFDTMEEGAKLARTTATGLTSLREARRAIEGGAFTGAGADLRLGLQKIGAALGIANSDKIANTETFRSAIAPQVAAIMRATVGSQNISNSDREFAEKAAGGSISLDEKSINRLLDIMERGSLEILRAHNARLERVYPGAEGKFERERAVLTVPFEERKVVEPPKQGDVVKGHRFLGGDPGDQKNWQKVQ